MDNDRTIKLCFLVLFGLCPFFNSVVGNWMYLGIVGASLHPLPNQLPPLPGGGAQQAPGPGTSSSQHQLPNSVSSGMMMGGGGGSGGEHLLLSNYDDHDHPNLTPVEAGVASDSSGHPPPHHGTTHQQQLPDSQQQQRGATGNAVGEIICSSVPGLVNRQRQVCEDHPDAMRALSLGARRGILECQHQFRNERWNCTTEKNVSVFGTTLQRGSKETAFIYAITSAGAVHAVTQACSAGNLTDCSCDQSMKDRGTKEGWKWGGCSDNVHYGVSFAKQFVDAEDRAEKKKKGDIRSIMNLHNNVAGRLAVQRGMELKCRCHGVSGSCELRTCWRTLPSFSQVGALLKGKYESSVQMSKKIKKRLRRRGNFKRRSYIRKEDLVHIHKSPNYCVEDPANGILGTSGRQCNKTATGPESCNLLCCGRGYNTRVIKHVERCQCKFHWCCYVTCKVCETWVEIYTCK